MLADYGVGGYCDDGKRLALGALDGPRFTCVKNMGDHLVLGDPDGGILIAGEQTQHASAMSGRPPVAQVATTSAPGQRRRTESSASARSV